MQPAAFFFYHSGVYREGEDMVAAAKVREFMLPRSVSMQAINDTVGQWKMLIMKPVQEINSNPFILNLRNGLFNVLDDSFKAHTPEYFYGTDQSVLYAGCRLPAIREIPAKYAGRGGNLSGAGDLRVSAAPVNKAQKSLSFGCAQRGQVYPA